MTAIQQQLMSVEEYIQYELKAECRHEYINGQLFEMPGEKDTNNEIAGFFYALFRMLLKKDGYSTYFEDMKVAIPNEVKYYYPDVFITAEPKTPDNRYIKYHPELIVEVVSKTSYINDTVTKFLDYTRIPSLKYYLVVNPNIPSVITYSKDAEGEWQAEEYTRPDDIIPLPLLNISLPVKEIFEIAQEGNASN
jgi:Uma2 family endonuclease